MVRYLNPADHHPARITKADKNFARNLHFKDAKFPVNLETFTKLNKKNSVGISLCGYNNIKSMYEKCCEEKHVHLLLIGEDGKKQYELIKDFNT